MATDTRKLLELNQVMQGLQDLLFVSMTPTVAVPVNSAMRQRALDAMKGEASATDDDAADTAPYWVRPVEPQISVGPLPRAKADALCLAINQALAEVLTKASNDIKAEMSETLNG